MTYQNTITQMQGVVAANGPSWAAIDPESAARMVIQNRFRTGLDIAKYTAKIMRADMAAYDADPAQYTQSLGCWHGFIAQQKLIAIKKHFGAPSSVTSTCRAGWSPRCAANSARCPTSRCTRRPRCPR
jgi:isocitrate lyase